MWKLHLLTVFLVSVGSSQQKRWDENEWDVLIFTQSWPNTVCLQWEEKRHDDTCLHPPVKNIWTIHGVWPTKLGTLKPQYCNDTWQFDEKKLSSIENELIIYWPNIHNGSRRSSLWEHEWEKHGTCASSLPLLDGEIKYFKQGLDWAKRYNITCILSQSGLNPSGAYLKVLEVVEAVKGITQRNPAVECYRDPKTNEEYLTEIRICFDKRLEVVDCDGILSFAGQHEILTNCPLSKGVVYPANVPSRPESFKDAHEDLVSEKRNKKGSPIEPWYFTLLKVVTFLQWFTL